MGYEKSKIYDYIIRVKWEYKTHDDNTIFFLNYDIIDEISMYITDEGDISHTHRFDRSTIEDLISAFYPLFEYIKPIKQQSKNNKHNE